MNGMHLLSERITLRFHSINFQLMFGIALSRFVHTCIIQPGLCVMYINEAYVYKECG